MTSTLARIDYEAWLAGSTESADVVVPLLVDAVRPQSAVDVGCGLGAWLAVFKSYGVEDVRGYDGPWVDRSRLLIAPSEYVAADLREPLAVDRRFDLALCLETAHMLQPEHAAPLVAALAQLAPVVAFSAGIPGQGGTMHRNEQWPRYWAELFAANGYAACDPFRLMLWEHPDLKWWFAQNLLVYADPDAVERFSILAGSRCDGALLPLVHPGCLQHVLGELESPRRRRPTLWPSRRERI